MPRVQININKVAFITNKETYSKNTHSFIVGIFAIHFQQNKRQLRDFSSRQELATKVQKKGFGMKRWKSDNLAT